MTVRAMLLLVAASALTMLAYVEFKDGMPPRFVYRDMPARVARLRPGMSRTEARAILGLDRAWYLGGSGPTAARPGGVGIRVVQDYDGAPEGTSTARLSDNSQVPNTVRLVFMKRPGVADKGGPVKLKQAAFCDRSGVVTMMPVPGRGSIRAGGGASGAR